MKHSLRRHRLHATTAIWVRLITRATLYTMQPTDFTVVSSGLNAPVGATIL